MQILSKEIVFIISFLVLTISCFPTKIYALTEQHKINDSYDYIIDKYNINITVNENNTFDIIETITAYFNVPRHGIYRNIPLINTIVRLDGTTSKNRTKIYNLNVDSEYTTYNENGNYIIKIGSSNKVFTGEQNYTIKYTYNIGKDPLKDKDEFYYNLIGTDWDTLINNISFNIKMPKEFDSNKINFSTGDLGSTNNNVTYTIQENTIIGNYIGTLNAKEALTIRIELPESYFVNDGFKINFTDYLMFFIPILFLTISLFLWYKFGRDKQLVKTLEFYPPNGLNSLEVAFLYKGKADNLDVVSLLIYLANKGYIKISEIDEPTNSKKRNFKISKLKEYDGNDVNEQRFLKGLFNNKTNKNGNNKNETTIMDLYNNFYSTVEQILSNINSKKNKDKIFETMNMGKIILIIAMIIISYCVISIPLILTYGNRESLLFQLIIPNIGFTIMILMLMGIVSPTNMYSSNTIKFNGIVIGIIFGFVPWIFIFLPLLMFDIIYLVGYLIGLGCIVGMIFCAKYMPKRTNYGNEMLVKIKGLKKIIKLTKKNKLESIVKKCPNYFYDILPFAYVLGVSTKWIKQFETISMKTPSWYANRDIIKFDDFKNTIKYTMKSAQKNMYSNSNGSSSGGISGSGSGGGGGGSW